MCFYGLGSIRDPALGSRGLAWLPCWPIRDDIAAGRLATVLDHLPSPVSDTHALWPQTPHVPPRLRFAIDALAAPLPSTHPSKGSASTHT